MLAEAVRIVKYIRCKLNIIIFIEHSYCIFYLIMTCKNVETTHIFKTFLKEFPKYVLSTKTLTLPTQDNGWLSVPPTELFNYHDNHSQQRPDSAG